MKIRNFGGNVVFEPRRYYEPKTDQEVLEILERHKDGKIRVEASGHAWSEAIESKDVLINLKNLNQVEIIKESDNRVAVSVQAGCRLQRLLDIIHEKTEFTLPTMGGIKKQTIAGATSTGTHGSGRPSLSHYLEEIRLAAYDSETGQAKIYELKDGDELRAARCALGCMGVILGVKFHLVPKYDVAETIVKVSSAEGLLSEDLKDSVEQAVLMPHLWDFIVFQRRIVPKGDTSSGERAGAGHRLRNYLEIDVVLHFFVRLMVDWLQLGWVGLGYVKWFYRLAMKVLRLNKTVVDESEPAITLAHDLFQHLETEIFIPKSKLVRAVNMTRHLVSWFAADSEELSEEITQELKSIEMYDEVAASRGLYLHHYPIYFRRILPDDALISMTAGASEPYYSMSFFTYCRPGKREAFYKMVRIISLVLTKLYKVRLHWGKYNPINYDEIPERHDQLKKFREIAGRFDSNGVFQNDYTRRVLGFPKA